MSKEEQNPLDVLAKQAAEMDQALEGLQQAGRLGGAIFKGLTDTGVSGFHASIAVGTALQAYFLNVPPEQGESA